MNTKPIKPKRGALLAARGDTKLALEVSQDMRVWRTVVLTADHILEIAATPSQNRADHRLFALKKVADILSGREIVAGKPLFLCTFTADRLQHTMALPADMGVFGHTDAQLIRAIGTVMWRKRRHRLQISGQVELSTLVDSIYGDILPFACGSCGALSDRILGLLSKHPEGVHCGRFMTILDKSKGRTLLKIVPHLIGDLTLAGHIFEVMRAEDKTELPLRLVSSLLAYTAPQYRHNTKRQVYVAIKATFDGSPNGLTCGKIRLFLCRTGRQFKVLMFRGDIQSLLA